MSLLLLLLQPASLLMWLLLPLMLYCESCLSAQQPVTTDDVSKAATRTTTSPYNPLLPVVCLPFAVAMLVTFVPLRDGCHANLRF